MSYRISFFGGDTHSRGSQTLKGLVCVLYMQYQLKVGLSLREGEIPPSMVLYETLVAVWSQTCMNIFNICLHVHVLGTFKAVTMAVLFTVPFFLYIVEADAHTCIAS